MSRHYIDNDRFEEMILRYQALKGKPQHAKEYHEVRDALVSDFILLAENVFRGFNFKLIDKDDALQEGVTVCLQTAEFFDPNRLNKKGEPSKAFNFLTTCCLNHFRQMHRQNKCYLEFKLKYHDLMLRKNPDIKGRHSVEFGKGAQADDSVKS